MRRAVTRRMSPERSTPPPTSEPTQRADPERTRDAIRRGVAAGIGPDSVGRDHMEGGNLTQGIDQVFRETICYRPERSLLAQVIEVEYRHMGGVVLGSSLASRP